MYIVPVTIRAGTTVIIQAIVRHTITAALITDRIIISQTQTTQTIQITHTPVPDVTTTALMTIETAQAVHTGVTPVAHIAAPAALWAVVQQAAEAEGVIDKFSQST